MKDSTKIGDVFRANDNSGTFTVTKFTRVGYDGLITYPCGRVAEGSVTYSQLENDFTSV